MKLKNRFEKNVSREIQRSELKMLIFFGISSFSVPEKNFALEKYGTHSRCFDHTNQMWVEKTCKQAREWQHWGSGCYQYKCEAGRLHIIVSIFSLI